jgi:uncharacterized protein YecT (DUF1311 family)
MSAAVIAAALLAAADPAAPSADCTIDEGGTNPEWAACMWAHVGAQETRLNRVWRELQPMLPKASRADLLAEQRAWIAYKEKSCRLWANGDWGREGQVLEMPACREAVVAARAKELEAIVDDLLQNQGQEPRYSAVDETPTR